MRRLILRLIDSKHPESLLTALRWLYGFVRPHRLAIIGLLGLSICASLLVLLQPWLTKLLIDDGLLARDFPKLVKIAAEYTDPRRQASNAIFLAPRCR